MPDMRVDVCVIGAGAAGLACAQGLVRQGFEVALLDRLHPMPDCLKAEKLEPEGIMALLRFGFGPAVAEAITPLRSVAVYFDERTLGTLHTDPPEGSALYHNLVNAMRTHIDKRVQFMAGVKATAVEAQDEGATVVTGDGSRVDCRLVVVATGDARHLLEGLGATYEPEPPHHVFAAAFHMEGSLLDHGSSVDSATYHHPVPNGPIVYATFFRLADSLRANIFCSGETSPNWQRDLKQRPLEAMAEHNHLLARASGGWKVTSPVITRKMDVLRMQAPRQPRLVVIGDAAHVIDPAGSGGLTFALLEAELLLQDYLSDWLNIGESSTPDIQAFYHDPRRAEAVREFFARGQYIFDLNHNTSLSGRSRRVRFAVRHMLEAHLPHSTSVHPDGTSPWHGSAPFLYEQFATAVTPKRKVARRGM